MLLKLNEHRNFCNEFLQITICSLSSHRKTALFCGSIAEEPGNPLFQCCYYYYYSLLSIISFLELSWFQTIHEILQQQLYLNVHVLTLLQSKSTYMYVIFVVLSNLQSCMLRNTTMEYLYVSIHMYMCLVSCFFSYSFLLFCMRAQLSWLPISWNNGRPSYRHSVTNIMPQLQLSFCHCTHPLCT